MLNSSRAGPAPRPTFRRPVAQRLIGLVCRIIGHSRSRSCAYYAGATWLSSCRRCGTRLKRTGPHRWRER